MQLTQDIQKGVKQEIFMKKIISKKQDYAWQALSC